MTSAAQMAKPRRQGARVYENWYRATPTERIQVIKKGIPAVEAKRFLISLYLPTGDTMRALRLSPATLNRKVMNHQPLAPEESERVIGLAKLVGQVESMIEESGNAEDFDVEKWLSTWLREPVPALGGRQPIDLLDTMEGQALVSETLGRMQSGAYA